MDSNDLPTINLAVYAQTDVGKVRSGNEDNFLIVDLSTGRSWTANEGESSGLVTDLQGDVGSLLAIADGAGGSHAGRLASRMGVEIVRDRMLQLQSHQGSNRLPFHERLRLSVEEANLLINDESQTNSASESLSSTITAVGTERDQAYFMQVGDSRAYLIRRSHIYRITKDQSLAQQLVDAGQITEEEADAHPYRNVILQALGAHHNVSIEESRLTLCNLDILILCSDGLWGKMSGKELLSIVEKTSDLASICGRLVGLANERGGEDNITVIVARFSGSGLAPSA